MHHGITHQRKPHLVECLQGPALGRCLLQRCPGAGLCRLCLRQQLMRPRLAASHTVRLALPVSGGVLTRLGTLYHKTSRE